MRDIVDRRNACLSALDPASLLTNIMENAAIGFVMMTFEGQVLYANRAFCAMIGFSETELLADGIDHLIHPDDRHATLSTFDVIRSGQAQSYQLVRRYFRKDGSILHALGAVSVHRAGTAGHPDVVILQLTDITSEKHAEARNAALHERLKLAVETSGAGVWDVDFSDEIYRWDSRLHELYGLKDGTFSGRLADWEGLMHPADVAGVRNEWRRTMDSSCHFACEYRICRPSGEVRHIKALAQIVRDRDGKALRAVGTSWDVTDYKRLNEEIFEEKDRLRITLASIGEAVICTDAMANVTFLNAIAESFTGWSARDAVGKPLADVLRIIDEATGDPAPNPVGQCFSQDVSHYRASGIFMLSLGGGVFDIQLSAAPVRRADGEMIGCVVVLQDVTTHRAAQKKITHNAQHDGLTGLPNRATFLARLSQVIEETGSGPDHHALCYIDLDRFKTVNDTGGHAAGDALLKEIAKIIALSCSKKDVPARLGGDEFGLILRNTSPEEARAVAERIVDAVCKMEFRWESMIFRVGASIGIAEISDRQSDGAVILHRADLACYSAKSSGRRCVHIYGLDDQSQSAHNWDDGKNFAVGN
ncbi:diguanylate cyclase domain-containing protein [Taklimakanibacter lacteus]|uniref:diguanylate cyclase domain-containing protein n=1 Tax=Taklimakanibacter lacteus TaxID=2268456 RepID=UPI000E660F55